MNVLAPDDRDLLKRVMQYAMEHDGNEEWRSAFAEWLDRDRPLSERQRMWLKGVADKLELEVEYLNEFSAGKVPRGEALATEVPAVLRAPLPMKPPGRRA